jgi:hypothetical protein
LPDEELIVELSGIADMIWILDLGELDPKDNYPDLYRMAPVMMGLMFGYRLDR